jgi:branched-chain amino acid transport system ATP-binding protein
LLDGIAGRTPFTAGTVRLGDHLLPPGRPEVHARLGIGRTFQRVEVFPSMTVAEHLVLALRAKHGTPRLWRDLRRLSKQTAAERAAVEATLSSLGIGHLAATIVGELGLGGCRLVEVARALVVDPSVLLLDEVSSGLSAAEAAALVDQIIAVSTARSMTVLAIEHDLSIARALAPRLLVLVGGETVADGPFDEVLALPSVVDAYLGSRA